MTTPAPKVQLTDDEWRKKLSPDEFAVLRRAGTERPFTGEYTDTETEGVYECRACGAELFRSSEKFESHCGWPSFFDPADSDAVILRSDDSLGMHRVEVLCANCHSHLGHVFEGEGYPTPTDQRYCINSISLRLVPTDQPSIDAGGVHLPERHVHAAVDQPRFDDPQPFQQRTHLLGHVGVASRHHLECLDADIPW